MLKINDHPLAGKTALITGAAKRLGRAIALELAARGANIVIHYHHSQEAAEKTAAGILALGRQVWLVAVDLADPEAVGMVIPQAVQCAGQIDFLINNASSFPESRLADFSAADLHTQINVNAFAPLVLSRTFAQHINQRADPSAANNAAILNLLDTRILSLDADHAAYHLSKRMLATLTKMLAVELAPAVRVNAVAPGAVLAPEGAETAHLERLASTIPLRRTGQPEDVARAAAYLLEETFITGQIIYVDGGEHMKGRMYD